MATGGVRRLRSVLELHKCGCRRFSTSHLFQKVGFIGLGNMGSRMADNLIKAGYDVAVHDINLEMMKRFSNKGIPTKGSPVEIAEASDVVITMLPSSHHVLDVYTGPNGLLTGGNSVRPSLFIDSSTIDPQTSRNVFGAVSGCSLREKKDGQEAPSMLDAPVSGGVLAAENGSLTFMVGGSEEAYIAAKPLFLSMGKNSIYCGGSGNGSSQTRLNVSLESVFCDANYFDRFISINIPTKICNNLAMAVSMLGVSEAFALGQSLGVASTTLTKIFNSSSARCWSSDTYNPVPGVMDGVPSSRNYEGGFMSKLMLKDLNLAQTSVKNVGLKCPLTSQAEEIYAKLCNDGYEAKDFSCVFRYYYSGKDEQ